MITLSVKVSMTAAYIVKIGGFGRFCQLYIKIIKVFHGYILLHLRFSEVLSFKGKAIKSRYANICRHSYML